MGMLLFDFFLIIFDFFLMGSARVMQAKDPPYFSRQVESAQRFQFAPLRGQAVQIESGGREECLPSYNVDRAHFPHYLIEFVSRGSADIRLGTERWVLQPGSLYAYDGKVPHRLAASSKNGMTKYFLALRGAAVRPLLSRYGLRLGHVVKIGAFGKVAEIFDDLVAVGCSHRREKRKECTAILRHLFVKIEKHAISHEPIGSGAYSTYRQCHDHITRHFITLRSAAEIAAACRIDPAYLCRLFRRFDRKSPYALLWSLRMAHAMEVLRSGGASVQQIAEDLGFADAASFSRSFKRAFDVAPGVCRRGAAHR